MSFIIPTFALDKTIKTMTTQQAQRVINLIKNEVQITKNEELSVMDRLTSTSCYDYEIRKGYYDAIVKRCISTIFFNREVKNCA